MANLNLSQFGENSSVSDADYTFVWDSANAISKRVSRNSWLNSGTLTSDAPVTISQTWNNAAVVFTGLKVNAAGTSGTNSASGSLLADFQLNGASLFKVQKNGRATFSTSTGVVFKFNEVSGSISGDSSNSFGTVFINGDQSGGGASVVSLGGGGAEGVTCRSSGFFAFSSSGNNALHANRDTILLRDEQYHLALRNGTNGQKFSVYGTYPGAAWERFTITAPTSGNVLLGTYQGTGGIARGLEFQTAGVTRMTIGANATAVFTSSVTIGNGAQLNLNQGKLHSSGRAGLGTPSDGVWIMLNDAENNFNRLQFGGQTNLYPSIKRVGTELQVVLASTGAAMNVAAGDADLTFIEDRYRRKGAGTPEGVVTAPIGAVYHNTTGGAGTSFYVKESGTGNTGWVGK